MIYSFASLRSSRFRNVPSWSKDEVMMVTARAHALVLLSASDPACRKLVKDMTLCTVWFWIKTDSSRAINAILKLHMAWKALACKRTGTRCLLVLPRCLRIALF